MAYVDKKLAQKIRNMIKAEFPAKNGWKWSVTIGSGHTSIRAALMQFPKEYDFPTLDYVQVNHFHIDKMKLGNKEKQILQKVNKILHVDHWDKSDSQIDYFNCAYYISLDIGKWDKPAQVSPK